MKISERKQRLRTRGVVPVSQEAGQWQKKTTSPGGSGRAASSTPPAKSAAPRSRWQPSPGYQIAFGVAYIVFAPILIWQSFGQAYAHAHPLKGHPVPPDPGIFGFAAPVVFCLFGLWWVYRGVQGRRRARAGAVAAIPTTTTGRKPRRGAVTDNEARIG